MECGNSLQICAMRVTLLDGQGNVVDAPDNMYISDKVIEVGVNPDVEAGATSELPGGCDCSFGSYRGKDKLKRWLFALSRGAVEPALLSLMLGATPIEDGADVIGIAWPDELGCNTDYDSLAFEFWTKHWIDDAQDSLWPWWHHVYPSTSWQIGDQTYGLNLGPSVLNGFSRTNLAWGQGPYGDGPGVDIRRGGFWLEDAAGGPPDAACGWQSATPGS